MNNNMVILQKVDGIYDIQPLVEPAYSTSDIILLSILIIISFTTTAYLMRKYYFSRKAVSKRKILKLQAHYLKNKISIHDAIYDLCFNLSNGFNVKYININTPLPVKIRKQTEKWHIFTKNLSELRYKNSNSTSVNIIKLFEESLYWLKIWP